MSEFGDFLCGFTHLQSNSYDSLLGSFTTWIISVLERKNKHQWNGVSICTAEAENCLKLCQFQLWEDGICLAQQVELDQYLDTNSLKNKPWKFVWGKDQLSLMFRNIWCPHFGTG